MSQESFRQTKPKKGGIASRFAKLGSFSEFGVYSMGVNATMADSLCDLWPEGRSPRVGTPSGGIREKNGTS